MIQKCQQYPDNYITGLRGRRWTWRREKLASSCVECRRERRKRSRRIERGVISQLTCKATPERTVSLANRYSRYFFLLVPSVFLRIPPSTLVFVTFACVLPFSSFSHRRSSRRAETYAETFARRQKGGEGKKKEKEKLRIERSKRRGGSKGSIIERRNQFDWLT